MNSIWDNLHDIKQPKKQRVILENSARKRAEYNSRYNKNNTVTVLVRLNKRTDEALIDYLNELKENGCSKSGFFKMAAKRVMFEAQNGNITPQ